MSGGWGSEWKDPSIDGWGSEARNRCFQGLSTRRPSCPCEWWGVCCFLFLSFSPIILYNRKHFLCYFLVQVGRPVIYGLAAKGELGVRRVMKMLQDELELTMTLSGCPTLKHITRTHVRTTHHSMLWTNNIWFSLLSREFVVTSYNLETFYI